MKSEYNNTGLNGNFVPGDGSGIDMNIFESILKILSKAISLRSPVMISLPCHSFMLTC
jgi:hypothetical protein